MKRDIITAEYIAAAHARNEKNLRVQANAVITPAARDDAARHGMEITREACALAVNSALDATGSAASAASPAVAKNVAQGVAVPASALSSPDLAAEVKRRVIAALPPEERNSPLIDKLVAEALGLNRASAPMNLLEACTAACRKAPKRIVFPDALDPRALKAAAQLQREGLAKPVLVGDPAILQKMASQHGVTLGNCACVNHESPELLKRNARDILEFAGQGKRKIHEDEALVMARNPLYAGAVMLRRGEADLGIGGNLSPTADVIRAGLRIIGLRKETKTVFGLFFMLAPKGGAVHAYADCAVLPEPTETQLADIAIGSADALTKLTGETARIALLSFSTKGSAEHPGVTRVRQALAGIKERRPDLLADGELQFDAATVPEVARLKSPGSPVAGNANVLVFPGIEAGNIAYKVAQRLGGYDALGPFLIGFDKGWHDLSRGCSADDIVKISVVGSMLP